MTEITTSYFFDHPVRIIREADTFAVVAADLAQAWSYADGAQLTRLLDDTELSLHVVQTQRGQMRETKCITEKGLNRLVSTLRRPELKEWQDELYGEIIPSYNRTGMALDPDRVDLSDPELVLRLAATAGELAKRYRSERDLAHQQVAELAPKADRYTKFFDTEEHKSCRYVARMIKPYGIREREFFDLLREDFGWICKNGTEAKVYPIDRGYMVNKTVYKPNGETIQQGMFTKLGIERIIAKLKLGEVAA